MKYKFQSYMDISTSADTLTMIKVAVGGKNLLQRTKHLWGAYKYFKLGSVSIKLMPASTLPVDPLGLSYANDDPQTVDPRDQMNPGLVRITNGEDLLDDFSNMSDTQLQQMYTNTMLDPRWSKFMLQSGFSRTATPLFWDIGQLHQDVFPGRVTNIPEVVGGGVGSAVVYQDEVSPSYVYSELANVQGQSAYSLFQTGHRQRIGWLPTDAFVPDLINNTTEPLFNAIPQINVITCILPKQYKTRYYYRLFITETVYFSGLKNTGIGTIEGGTFSEYRAVDNFMAVDFPEPKKPSQSVVLEPPLRVNTGGE